MTEQLHQAALAIRSSLREASKGLVDRETLVELIALTAIAGEHLLVIGPPGTAKSEAVRRVARGLGGRYFEYLLGRFTEPSEIFGPIDLKRLREGVVETQTAGMLPEVDIAFLDEVFLGSTAILNTLLGLLNERVFRRGHTTLQSPLRVCIGASNALPDEPGLAAFADRFLVRVFVEPMPDSMLEQLLEGSSMLARAPVQQLANLAQVDVLAQAARAADTTAIREPVAHAVRLLRRAGVELSDRRIVKMQRLACAAAVLSGRENPTAADLWPLLYAVPTHDAQVVAQGALHELFKYSGSSTLSSAVETASNSPHSRAARLAEAAAALLETAPADVGQREHWVLRVEGVLREIDASFDTNALPEALTGLRARLSGAIAAP